MRILTCATLIGAVLFVASCGPASPPPAPVVYTHPFKYRNSYDRFKDSTTVVLEIAPIRVNTEKGDYPFNTAFRLTTGHAGQTRTKASSILVLSSYDSEDLIALQRTLYEEVDWIIDGERMAWPSPKVEMGQTEYGWRYTLPIEVLEQIGRGTKVEWKSRNVVGTLPQEVKDAFMDFAQKMRP
jgi:hypothetical protein